MVPLCSPGSHQHFSCITIQGLLELLSGEHGAFRTLQFKSFLSGFVAYDKNRIKIRGNTFNNVVLQVLNASFNNISCLQISVLEFS